MESDLVLKMRWEHAAAGVTIRSEIRKTGTGFQFTRTGQGGTRGRVFADHWIVGAWFVDRLCRTLQSYAITEIPSVTDDEFLDGIFIEVKVNHGAIAIPEKHIENPQLYSALHGSALAVFARRLSCHPLWRLRALMLFS